MTDCIVSRLVCCVHVERRRYELRRYGQGMGNVVCLSMCLAKLYDRPGHEIIDLTGDEPREVMVSKDRQSWSSFICWDLDRWMDGRMTFINVRFIEKLENLESAFVVSDCEELQLLQWSLRRWRQMKYMVNNLPLLHGLWRSCELNY